MSNQQVYDFLMGGAEEYPVQSEANQLADMRLTIYNPPRYRSQSSTLAFTSVDDPYLHIYKKYYQSATVAELSNTLVHEWTHKMGFDHDYDETPQRPYSVPYGVGDIIEELVSKYLGQK